MNDEIPLPTVWNDVVDAATLDLYFRELASHARMVNIQEKQAALSYAGSQSLDLKQAQTRIMSGDTRGIQIHYVYEEAEWCDTLLNRDNQIRLIRMKQ